MLLPSLLTERFIDAISGLVDDPSTYASMIRGTNDPKFGDYQANCAMPLSKRLSDSNPREVATKLVGRLAVDDICDPPEIAGPGFINLKIKDAYLTDRLVEMLGDSRCLVAKVDSPSRIVIDFSSPNVAKPMHVGHIRSTVIGDSLSRILRFLGHTTITDNHLGDWGTQFGMIIYGYKHFGDPEVVAADPVPELASLYRLVNRLIDYRKAIAAVDPLQQKVSDFSVELDQLQRNAATTNPAEAKKAKKAVAAAQRKLAATESNLAAARSKISAVESDPELYKKAEAHPAIDAAVLAETAKLHEGDPTNLELWEKFLPFCKDEVNRIYDRLNVSFDHTLGESFYHPMLAGVVEELQSKGLAEESDGAVCVFLPNFDAPMIVRKQDGAFLYATTDLATLKYRLTEFEPDEIVYVVDTRQSEHFDKLFAAAAHLGMEHIKLAHVNFGTVLGPDGKPIKTRSGSSIGLESLLDDAVSRARQVVCDPERLARMDPPMDDEEQSRIAEAVGIGAIKYADLSHHRTSDYRFNLDKMVALEGNTATYIQYSYARIRSILRKTELSEEKVVAAMKQHGVMLTHPAERALTLRLLKLEEALVAVRQDFAPNHLVDYLYETAKTFAIFNENCHVLRAETDQIKTTRLALITLCGRVLRTGLELLGIDVVERM